MLREHAFVETAIAFRLFGKLTYLVARHLILNIVEKRRLDPFTGAKRAFYRSVVIKSVHEEVDLQIAVMSAYTHMLNRANAA